MTCRSIVVVNVGIFGILSVVFRISYFIPPTFSTYPFPFPLHVISYSIVHINYSPLIINITFNSFSLIRLFFIHFMSSLKCWFVALSLHNQTGCWEAKRGKHRAPSMGSEPEGPLSRAEWSGNDWSSFNDPGFSVLLVKWVLGQCLWRRYHDERTY